MNPIPYVQAETFAFCYIFETTIRMKDEDGARHGFTTSRPRPIIRYVSPGDFYDIERPIRFKSRPSFPVTVQGVTAAGNTIRLRARILNPVGLSADMVQF